MMHLAQEDPCSETSRNDRHFGLLACILALACGTATTAAAEEPARRLPEVVVSASRVPLPAKEIGSAVSEFTAEDIERRQARFASEVLREVPGVAVSRSGPLGTFTQVRIRGAEGNQTLVLIDGVRVNDPSGGAEFDLANMLAADIERIEVLRGPQSALYGSEAIGGVINIITKRGTGPATVGLSAEGGSFRTGQVSANLRGGSERYHFSLGGTGFTTDGVSVAPASEGNTEKDGYRNQTYNAKLGFVPVENLEIDLFARYVDATVETDPQPAVAGIIRTVDGDNETDSTERIGRAQAKYNLFNGSWEHILGAGYSGNDADTFANGSITFESRGEIAQFDYQTNVFFDTRSVADASHTLTLYAERRNEAQVTRSSFGSSDLDVTNDGYVGEYSVGLQEQLFLTGAIRYDDNDSFKNATTYRTTAAYLHERTASRIHASYGTGVKNPTLFELFGFGPNFVPNPNLRPEESRGWDAGIEKHFLDDRLSLDLTYFNNRITDLIQGSGNTAVNVDDNSRIQGLEATATGTLAAGFTFNAQYTFTDGKDANGARLVRRPKHLATANFNYAFLDGRANANMNVRYNGEQRDYQFSNFFATRTTVTLDDFLLIGLAATYEVVDNVVLFGRVENLLDEDYQEVLGFSNPGIVGFVGVRTQLKF